MKTTRSKAIQSKTKLQSNGSIKAKPGAATELRELFEDELKEIYWAEKALVKSYPNLIKNVSSSELSESLERHLSSTEKQVTRNEEIFASIELKPEEKKCEAMVGLIKEAEEEISSTQPGMVRDAAIIAASQKIEHYEIASYGTLLSFARTLGFDEAIKLLEVTLEEEKEADSVLTNIAETSVNAEAVAEE